MNIVLYSVRLGDSEHKPISDVFTNATDGGGQGQFSQADFREWPDEFLPAAH